MMRKVAISRKTKMESENEM